MKPLLGLLSICVLALVFVSVDVLDADNSTSVSSGGISVQQGWVRAVPWVAKNTAAYMTIISSRTDNDQLLSASTPVAESVEVHRIVKTGRMMEMQRVDDLEIPAAGEVELKPGGYHLMLIGLKPVPAEGETVSLTLHFKAAGAPVVDLPVRRPAGY
ncbi:MAG: copper chaperone PCu(A)C [Motiliproteus sp.]|nr:copper chaperone PCu(A)C [Motiliproteus sp.]MCW9051854.1 copper chaperone PCu(A)C [Motiliproteus sp.]